MRGLTRPVEAGDGVPHTVHSRLFVVVAVLGGASAFESPVDLVGVGVPPFAHPVFEAGEQDDRDRVGGGGGDRADGDLRVGGDEGGLRGDGRGDDLHRICIGTRHDTYCTRTPAIVIWLTVSLHLL